MMCFFAAILPSLQELMAVMDKLKDGGVQRVGLVTRLPEDR